MMRRGLDQTTAWILAVIGSGFIYGLGTLILLKFLAPQYKSGLDSHHDQGLHAKAPKTEGEVLKAGDPHEEAPHEEGAHQGEHETDHSHKEEETEPAHDKEPAQESPKHH